MRIYLAARYSRREELCGYRADLIAMGHQVTSRWLNGAHQVSDAGLSDEGSVAERERFALEDYTDVGHSDLCISFSEEPRSGFSRGGRHVEHGIALGRQIQAWVVGPRENVFHCLPEVRVFPTWAECMAYLEAR
jgi:hypothetical protein